MPAPRSKTLLITPYLNTRAFVHHGAPPNCELGALAPREATRAIAAGSAIGGVVPVGGLRRLAGLVSYVGAYGIACRGAVDSVLFFSNIPFDDFDERSRVALTFDSMTSVRLLYLLFSYRDNARGLPRPVDPGEDAEGELAIGDRALKMLRSNSYRYVVDLSDRWYRRHGVPIVFARWVLRRDTPAKLRKRIHEWLMEYACNEHALLDVAAANDGHRAGLERDAARAYLAGIRTVLRPEDLRGQRIYERDLAQCRYFEFLETPESTGKKALQV